MLWPGVCPSFISPYCIETVERIKMFFGTTQFDVCKFIALNVHTCLQRSRCEAKRRACSSSATAETCTGQAYLAELNAMIFDVRLGARCNINSFQYLGGYVHIFLASVTYYGRPVE